MSTERMHAAGFGLGVKILDLNRVKFLAVFCGEERGLVSPARDGCPALGKILELEWIVRRRLSFLFAALTRERPWRVRPGVGFGG
jgi:hypothetical protein